MMGNLFRLQSNPQFVAASVGCGCVWEGPSCAPRLGFASTELGGRSVKGLRHHEMCLYLPLPDGCLLALVTDRASGGIPVAYGRFSVSHQLRVSVVLQIDTGSHALPVLNLRVLSKSLRVYQV